jgi:hypothetical protein
MYQARASVEESRRLMARTGLSRIAFGRAWLAPWSTWVQDSDEGQFYLHRSGLSTEGLTEGLTNVAVNYLNIGQRPFSKKKRSHPTGTVFALRDLIPCLRRVEAEAIPSLYIIMLDMVESHAIDNAV